MRSFLLLTLSAGFAILVLGVVPAAADPIVFTFEYHNASITVGGTTYGAVPLTITAFADTSNVRMGGSPSQWFLDYVSMALDVGGIVSGTFSGSGYVFVNGQTVGFGIVGDRDFDLAYIAGLPFPSYDLSSSIGPLVGLATEPGQWTNVPTSLGLTTLNGLPTSHEHGTFTAVVPEPASCLLLGVGLAAVGLAARKRRTPN